MNRIHLQKEETPSASASISIICCSCGIKKTWNEAVESGWTADPLGRPFQDYYCETCSKKIGVEKTTVSI